jgi:hypothetical protein
MPFLFPDMKYHEERYYTVSKLMVSPDGSFHFESGIEYAFERKTPTGNTLLQFSIVYQIDTLCKFYTSKRLCRLTKEH